MPWHGDKMSGLSLTSSQFGNARNLLGMTQKEVATWLGITTRTVIRYENDSSTIPLAIVRLMRLAQISASDPEQLGKLARAVLW